MKKGIGIDFLGLRFFISSDRGLKKVLLCFIQASALLFICPANDGAGTSVAQAVRIKASPQHEVTVTLKLVQVYITDRDGNSVLDLKKDDFVVLDNGKKQSLTEFERHVLAFMQEPEKAPPGIPVPTPLPAPKELMSRKFFLLFDFAFNNAVGLEKAKKAALHFLDTQMQPTDEVGVLSYSAIKSLTLHEYLTTDHRKVRDLVRAFGMKEIAGRAEDFEARLWALLKEENPRDASESGFVFDPQKERKQELGPLRKQREEARFQAYIFVGKMTELAKALRYVPGRKSIVFLSSGVPYSLVAGIPAPEVYPLRARGIPVPQDPSQTIDGSADEPERFDTTHLASRYEDMAKELSSANCAIYALDTQELRSSLDSDLQTRGTFSLQKLTSATGGKYFGNINSYEQHLERIQNLTGCYYVLGYYIDEKWDGAYHKIKVEVTRPGCQVHAQRGYFNPKPFKEYTDLERMLHLVDLALTERPLFQTPLRLPAEAIGLRQEANLCLISRVQIDKLQEVLKGKVEIVNIIFDEKGNIVELRRVEKTPKEIPGESFYHYSLFSLPPGAYKCRLVIRNLETGRGAVASSSAVIGKSLETGVHLFPPLFLAPEKNAVYVKGFLPKKLATSPTLSLSDYFRFDPAEYSPCLEFSAKPDSLIPAILHCSTVGIADPRITISASLIDKSSKKDTPLTLFLLSDEKEGDQARFLVNIHIPELRAGEYALQLTAAEHNSMSTSQVSKDLQVK